MIFRQLFCCDSCTYTYLLGCEGTGQAIFLDPVREHVERDVQLLEELGLTLAWSLETHVHADHVTGAGLLRERLGCQTAMSHQAGADCADRLLRQGDVVQAGELALLVRETPGHTNTCVTYVLADESMAFTGDAIFVRGCGRTDFQNGDAATLFRSVHTQIFSLPDSCLLYPAHDYKGHGATTVAEERAHNPRLGGGKSLEAFVAIMDNLNLSMPKHIEEAVPANLSCGRAPTT